MTLPPPLSHYTVPLEGSRRDRNPPPDWGRGTGRNLYPARNPVFGGVYQAKRPVQQQDPDNWTECRRLGGWCEGDLRGQREAPWPQGALGKDQRSEDSSWGGGGGLLEEGFPQCPKDTESEDTFIFKQCISCFQIICSIYFYSNKDTFPGKEPLNGKQWVLKLI